MARGGIKPWQLFAALAIVIIFLFVAFTPAGTQLSGFNGNTTTQSGTIVTKPLQITCFDALSRANCGAVTVTVITPGGSTLEAPTATSSGVATTGGSYRSGTQLIVEISGNSKATEFLPVTVPTAYVTDTNIIFTVYAVTLGAWTQTMTGTNGATTFVSGSQYGLASFTGSQTTITDTITESSSNSGYKSSYDVTNLLNQYWMVQVSDGGGASSSTQYLQLTGLPLTKSGNTNYYDLVCPDGLSGNFIGQAPAFSPGAQSAGTSSSQCSGKGTFSSVVGLTAYGGSVSFSFTVQAGTLASGQVETLSFKIYYYADPAYFAANGNNGPNAAQSGSTFTLKFNP